MLKVIYEKVLPVRYGAAFYASLTLDGSLAKLVYFNDLVVGGITCRIKFSKQGVKQLVIQTIGTLAPYRR